MSKLSKTLVTELTQAQLYATIRNAVISGGVFLVLIAAMVAVALRVAMM